MTYILGGVFFLVMFFGLHGAACNMHVAAVEMLRRHPSRENAYAWSYNYCQVVGAPLRAIIGD